MEDFDLGKLLRQYRKRNKLSFTAMAAKAHMSRSRYGRIENGEIRLTLEEKIEIADRVELVIPKEDERWNRPRRIYWFVPIFFACLCYMMLDMDSFKASYGGEKAIKEHPPYVALAILIVILTTFWWWYLPPKKMFTLRQAKAWLRKIRRARISWFKITYREEKESDEEKKGKEEKK